MRNGNGAVRVLVAGREQPPRAALLDLIEGEAALELVGAAADTGAAIELARSTRPDVALLDVRMPGGGGPRAAREIRAASSETRVLALSARREHGNALEMLRAGAIGYLVKGDPPTEILEAIHRAARGRASLPADFVARLAGGLSMADPTCLGDGIDRGERGQIDRDIAARRAVLSHLVAAEEEQRRRIAGDIHDDSIQVMTAAGMRLQILRRALVEPEQIGRLEELEKAIAHSIARLRHLVFELRPFALEREGLAAALKMYLDEAAKESGTVYELRNRLLTEPPEQTRIVLYRIAQEVLTNVRKRAAASATVTIGDREDGYSVQVRADGAAPARLELAGTQERAELAGGWLRIEQAEGQGTTVEIWLPRADGAARTAMPQGAR